ncbi:hypothetical protein MMC30_000945 [Trapelia coarctata]|nr:hypothetical protein [Trapelia coarctata]
MSGLPRSSPAAKPTLIQTTLTSAFFSAGRSNAPNTTRSPYFAKPPPGHNLPSLHSLNLLPDRRPNRPRSLSDPTSLQTPSSRRSTSLSQIAAETKAILPNLLAMLPSAAPTGTLYSSSDLHGLHQHRCPNFLPSPISVVNADTLDTAIDFPPSRFDAKPVLVLNMANAEHGGGGWLNGALAQEESLCYRSSLSFTLKRRFYPLGPETAIYSPRVVVFRENLEKGHGLLDLSQPQALPVVSVVSVAAIRDPEIVKGAGGRVGYKYKEDEELMKVKMRVALRVAGREGHKRLVLGALGCGAFGNPRGEVVRLWKEVLCETEFDGWWEEVVFAVMERGGTRDGDGNFGVFFRGLDGMMV